MAKEVIVLDGKYYFYESDTGDFFEIHLDKIISPSKELVKALYDQTVELSKFKK